MKPKVPVVPLPVWKDLHAAAQTFGSLKPWELLDDLDVVCVRDPANGDTGFGATMGSGGELFGFALYRGAEGFDMYRKLTQGDRNVMENVAFVGQNCLKLDFCSRAEMEKEDIAVQKRLNLAFKGKFAWPQFRSLLPGFAAWFLTEAEARFFTLGLKAACTHYHRVEAGMVNESLRDNECLMYTPVDAAQTEFRSEWEPLPVLTPQPIALPILDLARIKSLQSLSLEPDTAWEADIISLPSPIMDYERPYYIRMTGLCRASSGFAFQTDIGKPGISDHQLMADAICSAMEKHKLKPDIIYVKSAEHADAVRPLANIMQFSVLRKKNLDAVQNLREALMDRLMSGKL
jgi:hypothetical protein